MTGFALLRVHMLLCLSDMQSVPKQGLELWLSAHDLALRRAVEGKTTEPVVTWPDASGHGRHANSSGATVTFTNNVLGRVGVPAVVVPATSILKVPAIETITNRAARTIVFAAVVDQIGSVSGNEIFSAGTTMTMISLSCHSAGTLRIRTNPSSVASMGVFTRGVISNKTMHVITIISTASLETSVFVDGVRQTISAAGSGGHCGRKYSYRPSLTGDIFTWSMNIPTLTIGGGSHLAARGFRGKIAEFLIYSKALNETERQQVESHVLHVTQNKPTTVTTSTRTTTSTTSTVSSSSTTTSTTSSTTTSTSTTSSTHTQTTSTSSTTYSSTTATSTTSTTLTTSTTSTSTLTTTTTSTQTTSTLSTSTQTKSTVTLSTVSTTSTTRTFTPLMVLQTAEPLRSHVWVTIALVLLVCFLLATVLYLWRKNKILERLRSPTFAVQNEAYYNHQYPQNNTETTTYAQPSDNVNDEITMYEQPQDADDDNYVHSYSAIPDSEVKNTATPDDEFTGFEEPTYDTFGEEGRYMEVENKSKGYSETYTETSYVTIPDTNDSDYDENHEAIYV
eukprot:m.277555 g.277555  ORF g.277555 m.277555 type:complete len:563 (+) comp16308_c0_seq6:386-2074(+)